MGLGSLVEETVGTEALCWISETMYAFIFRLDVAVRLFCFLLVS